MDENAYASQLEVTTRAAAHNSDEEHSPVFAGSWDTWG